MAKKILPFWLYPSHWGLKGQAKELAEIDFYYDGLEAALKRADIVCLTKIDKEKTKNELRYTHGEINEFEFEMAKVQIDFDNAVISKVTYELNRLDVQFKFGQIDEREYDSAKVEMIKDEDKKYIAALEFALKYNEITQNEYDKELATFNREPWFLFDVDFDEENNDLIMSFDYNEYFWKKLREEGHPGNDEHEIIDNFIKDWGRKLATEDYSGDYDTKLTSINDERNQQTGSGDFKIYE
ncbi:virion structural protein [Pectobacterium phage vB_PcaM_CBB]|uniref:Structural protein n=1 Tax=Pectobacterium phage vB_PcaM_CBB TaxID=2772511 RepID=A0A1L2CUY4_9CAUD|nr:virion structural protein [Pectobacterium phage vB_PcaM_CBB]AMM43833.1 structural protein [Pectobacterium phage vB_PcaM_CBB]